MIHRGLRQFATSSVRYIPTYNVAIVGAGPAGFYTAHNLLQRSPSDNFKLNVHFFERNPTPYGLSRYGVAPDHPEVKNCEEYLDNIIEKYGKNDPKQPHTVKFYGNINIGKDISLKELEQKYHSVVLSYGCTNSDNELKIPGHDLKGVISARHFVNWYNGHPDYHGKDAKFEVPDFSKIENVIIIGNGNVALDVARVMMVDYNRWQSTDISMEALEALKQSSIKNLSIVARRGILESAYSNKELRELLELSKGDLKFDPVDKQILDPLLADVKKLGRIDKRRVSLLDKYSKANNENATRKWSLKYLRGPKEIIGHNDKVCAVKFSINEVIEGKVLETDDTETIPTDLVILSIGYKGTSLEGFESLGIKFELNKIKNDGGRVLNTDHQPIPGWYTSGWIKNGPKGVIATTMTESFETSDKIIEDLKKGIITSGGNDSKTGIHNLNSVSWDQWLKINVHELQEGEKLNRSRVKLETRSELLRVAQG